jgi:hypothetical protein
MKFWEEFTYFAYVSHSFEVLEHNLMEINLSELTLILFSSISLNLNKFTVI